MRDTGFRNVADCVREHALAMPEATAFVQRRAAAAGHAHARTWVEERLSWMQFDALVDRIAATLQQRGLQPGHAVALCGASTPLQAALFLAALRAGVAAAPLAPSVSRENFAAMLADAQARWLFVDGSAAALVPADAQARCVALDAAAPGTPLEDWLAAPGARPVAAAVTPESPFNIIYSSGTTGTPKGIVQPHGMRWMHVLRGARYGYGPQGTTLLATPLYSNTTLVVFFITVAEGGTTVLMDKFDAGQYLALAQQYRATHSMLVPVQYRRILARPDFDSFDLSAFRFKFCTSAPFPAELKAEVLARWPGGLVEFYGMTEGGGTCILDAHLHPDKLNTVGRPSEGHDIRLIDEAGREVAPGEAGEVVGHSPGMMSGYHGRPELTREAEWFATDGKRFIRTGDVGRFDADGFLLLFDRRKDMVISGGFNIYPSDLEAVLQRHPAVAEAAVVGVPSEQWGETPVAFAVRRQGASDEAEAVRLWANEQLGKTQRLAGLRWVDELPRSAIGKVLKRELREAWRRPDAAAPR